MSTSTYRRITRALSAMLCCGVCSAAFSQNVGVWTVDCPTSSIKLVGVESVSSSALRFLLKNTTSKDIIYYTAVAPNGNMTGTDGFVGGTPAISAGATDSVTFGLGEFSHNNQLSHEFSISAIIYADGTSEGSKQQLDEIEDEMLGAALETRRDAAILSSSQNGSAADVGDKIGRRLPTSSKDAADMLSDVTLPNVPQSYITARLRRASGGIQIGVSREKERILRDADNEPKEPVSASIESSMTSSAGGDIRDIANKYRSLSEKQCLLLSLLTKISNEN